MIPVDRKVVVINGRPYKQWDTADNEVGWHNLSARPGQAGNTVLAGHSDVYAQVFRNLEAVKVGDEVIVRSGEQAYRYIVTARLLVQERGVSLQQRIKNARLIAPTDDERVTLITCANPGATHRLVVIALPAATATQ